MLPVLQAMVGVASECDYPMEVNYDVYVLCLQTAGHSLMLKYNKQFKKLLFVLCKEYVHK